MPTGEFSRVLLSSIIIDPDRQREGLPDIESLAASIAKRGLLQPLVITREGRLVAGRRRLAAVTVLGWMDVPVQWTDEIDPSVLAVLELEENVKRVDLSWQERIRATYRYHMAQRELHPGWTIDNSAEELACSHATVAQALATMQEATRDPSLLEAETYSTARGMAARAIERRRGESVDTLLGRKPAEAAEPQPRPSVAVPAGETPAAVERRAQLFNADFHSWKPPHRFNLIHCDFPYGIGAGNRTRGIQAKTTQRLGEYNDSADVFWDLLSDLNDRIPSLCDDQCHLIFWLSMNYYEETRSVLRAAGWRLDNFPFIWHKSDNSGIVPDPQRGGRRTYEVALLASRGDRKVVKSVALSFAAGSPKDFHAHQKPHAMLTHLLSMYVDASTIMLDPTCGSASAIKAAEEIGAGLAIGLERDEEFFRQAQKNLGMAQLRGN